MLLRWLATIAIALLLLLDVLLPETPIGRRGAEAAARTEVADSIVEVGEPFPPTRLVELDGTPFDLAQLRDHRVLLTFERSVDW